MKREVYEDGRLVELQDDETRLITRWDASGNQIGDPIPYNDVQNQAADLRRAKTAREINEVRLRTDVPPAITEILQALQTLNNFLAKSNATINADFSANPALTLRPIAAALRLVIRNGLRLAKLVVKGETLDSPDVGA